MWEGVGDRTELQYIDLHSYGRQRCVFLALQGCSTGGPGAQLSAGWWLSLLHLITNWSPKLHRRSRGPFRPGLAWLSLPYLISNFPGTQLIGGSKGPLGLVWLSVSHLVSITPTVWLLVLTELYKSSTLTQSPTQSLEWHVWSSSSGNNSHAVQRSLSSGVSVYECIMEFFPCSILLVRSTYMIFPHKCLPVHNLEWHIWPGGRSKYNNTDCPFQPPMICWQNSVRFAEIWNIHMTNIFGD